MNIRFITTIGVGGLILGLSVAAVGIVLGAVPVIIAGTIILAVTFVSMQAGWCLSPGR